MNEQEMYKKAIELWGSTSQMLMVVEEAAELTQALMKSIREGAITYGVVEEAVDLQITLNQLKAMINMKQYDEIYEYKIGRLRGRIARDTR